MIESGDTVAVHYALWVDEKAPIESTFDAQPEVFVFGSGEFPPYLEQRLAALAEGESTQFLIPASARVFGAYDPGNSHRVAISEFEDGEPEPGSLMEFGLPNGERVSGRIVAVAGNDAIVDFNHPLAGRDVHCQMQRVALTSIENQ